MAEMLPPTTGLLEQLRGHLAREYAIERELARGGMAVVYRAREIDLNRTVALKVLPPQLALNEGLAERFKREARMTASLDHPNIIPVYRVGQAGTIPYMAMKYIEGRPLDSIIEVQGALPIPVIVHILRAATAALSCAHESGIVHRDIKGGNILIDREGRVVVTDFGIARAIEDAAMTGGGIVVGTPYFMSPEQCGGKPAGPQSDQYSLGIVAYQMLTGVVPFRAESLASLMQQHITAPLPPIAARREGVPRELTGLVERALAKRPEARFATTADMQRAVEALPFDDADRRQAVEMLRTLAAGGTIPRVVTIDTSSAETLVGTPAAADARGAQAHGPMARLRMIALSGPSRARLAWGRGGHERRSLALLLLLTLALIGGGVWAAYAGTAEARVARASRMYAAGDRAGAREAFRDIAADHPTLATPHVYLGRMAREEGDLVEARRSLVRAVELDPRNAMAMRELGSSYFAAGEYERARRFYVRALSLDSSDRLASGYLGCSLVRLGRVPEGRRFIARAGPGPWVSCEPRR